MIRRLDGLLKRLSRRCRQLEKELRAYQKCRIVNVKNDDSMITNNQLSCGQKQGKCSSELL